MSFLTLSEELESALSAVCHIALQAKGLDAISLVNTVIAGVKSIAPAAAAPIIDDIAPVIEAVAVAEAPVIAPALAAIGAVAEPVSEIVNDLGK